MKLVHPEIGCVFDFDSAQINSLIIENPGFMFRFLSDVNNQISGSDGVTVVSENDKLLDLSKSVEILDSFISFEINRKNLITKLTVLLEKQALSPEYYERTMQIMRDIELYLNDISFDFPCELEYSHLSVLSLIKSVGPEVMCDSEQITDRLLDYFEFSNIFERGKLFILVNLRSLVNDTEMELFSQTVLSHGYRVLLLENVERQKLSNEKRWIIDNDLCEIG